jgi:hypothetical protein
MMTPSKSTFADQAHGGRLPTIKTMLVFGDRESGGNEPALGCRTTTLWCSSKIRILAATAAAGSARDQDPARKRLHSSSIGGAAHPLPSRRAPLQFMTRMRSKALSPRKDPIRVAASS